MRIALTILGLSVLAPALFAADTAVLRNGFSIEHNHRQEIGATTRLYLTASDDEYVDVLTENVSAIEKGEQKPATAAQTFSAVQIQLANSACCRLMNTANSSVAAQSPVLPDINALVEKSARENQLDSDFVRAVIGVESGGYAHAVSNKGAQGLMQLMPQTAAALGVRNSFDRGENIGAGTSYLRSLLARYHNDPVRALAAYNAGSFRVQQYGGVPPYGETQAYVARVIRDFNRRKLASTKSSTPKPPKPSKISAENHPPRGD